MLTKLFKQWSDFSSRSAYPLFWMLLGPLLVMLTLIVAIPTLSNPFLPLITVMGVVVSWRFRMSGFALTLMVFVLYFSLHYFLGHREALLWKMGWGCSLALGLTISFLCMEELRTFYSREKERKDKAISELKLSLYSAEEKGAVERRSLEREVEEFKGHQKSLEEEIEALLNLVEGSRIESEKMIKQSDNLSAETLKQHRQIESLRHEVEEAQNRADMLQEEHESLASIAGKRLKDLNTKRVELYQARHLIENYENQLKRAREYFLAQKKKKPKQPPPPTKNQSQQLVLHTLEKDKGMIKKSYDQTQEDFQSLKKALEEGKAKLQKTPDDEIHAEVEKLGAQVVEKKNKLEQTKAELIGIEREIFVIKKGLQEKGAFAP